MSSLPFEIVLISLPCQEKKAQASFVYNYAPAPPLTWKQVRDHVG
jgi:hypothetical protein